MTDFFISYKSDNPDRKHQTDWALWVARTLEDHGYTVKLQEWDFNVGTNIVLNIHEALQDCDRVVALLSPAYLESSAFTRAEWAATLMESPDGGEAKLIPLVVEECSPSGILKPLVYQRLVDLDERAARTALLRAVSPNQRRRAATFPGGPVRGGGDLGRHQPRDALVRGGFTRFHLTRSDYSTTLREYLDQAEVSITLISIYLTAKGSENDLLALLRQKLKSSDNFQVVVSLLDPDQPVLTPAAATLSMSETDLRDQIESMTGSLWSLRSSLPKSVRRRFELRLHPTLPPASAVLLDENISSGRIQLETRLYKAPGSESFGFEVAAGTDFYSRLLNSYHRLLRDSRAVKDRGLFRTGEGGI